MELSTGIRHRGFFSHLKRNKKNHFNFDDSLFRQVAGLIFRLELKGWRRDTQQNDTLHVGTQRKDPQHDETQLDNTQHKDAQRYSKKCFKMFLF
jgi:hypothetical protein